MFEINYKSKEKNILIKTNSNQNLRSILIENGVYPYNGNAKYLNCRSLGTCGTCAVTIIENSNEYDFSKLKTIEKLRLNFIPHNKTNTINNQLRLACQYFVNSDIIVIKNDGFWGHQ